MEYNSAAELVKQEMGQCINVECGQDVSNQILEAIKIRYSDCRCAFLFETDRGYERQTIKSYLKFFTRISDSSNELQAVLNNLELTSIESKKIKNCNPSELKLISFARVVLSNPEVCFCERLLSELEPNAKRLVLRKVEELAARGVIFITTLDPLRISTSMPGRSFWYDEGHFVMADIVEDDNKESEVVFAGDEVQVIKIPAKSETATLLLDPKEIDFVESSNKSNYVSVRGNLYQTNLTLDELEDSLIRFGFFRCHRSYIVNVQKVSKVERYTRNSFNLTLSDTNRSSIPLAKGRAEEMRDIYGW